MSYPQFKDVHSSIFNRRTTLSEMRQIDMRSLVGLYVSESLLFLGIILIFLNNLNVLAPGSYFGAVNYVTVMVFSMGIVINFVSIPFLYFSSFNNFKKENDFWDKQIFWILPLFFFGTFFLYGSEMFFSLTLVLLSVLVIALVHLRFFLSSKKMVLNGSREDLADHSQYFESLKYLTFYYLLFFFCLIWYNPIQQIFIWVRFNL